MQSTAPKGRGRRETAQYNLYSLNGILLPQNGAALSGSASRTSPRFFPEAWFACRPSVASKLPSLERTFLGLGFFNRAGDHRNQGDLGVYDIASSPNYGSI